METELFTDLAMGLGPAVGLAMAFWKLMTKTIVRVVDEFKDVNKQQREDFIAYNEKRDTALSDMLKTHQDGCSTLHNANREQVYRLISRIPKSPTD